MENGICTHRTLRKWLPATSAEARPCEKLSDREKQVLKLVAKGYTHKEIAVMLTISVKTAIVHQASTGKKLGFQACTDLIALANEHPVAS